MDRLDAAQQLLTMFTPSQQRAMADYVRMRGTTSNVLTTPDGTQISLPVIFAPLDAPGINSGGIRTKILVYFIVIIAETLIKRLSRDKARDTLAAMYNLNPGSTFMTNLLNECFTMDDADKLGFADSAYFGLVKAYNALMPGQIFDNKLQHQKTNNDWIWEMSKVGEKMIELSQRSTLMTLGAQMTSMLSYVQAGDPEAPEPGLTLDDLVEKLEIAGALADDQSIAGHMHQPKPGTGDLLSLAIKGAQFMMSPRGKALLRRAKNLFKPRRKFKRPGSAEAARRLAEGRTRRRRYRRRPMRSRSGEIDLRDIGQQPDALGVQIETTDQGDPITAMTDE